MKTWPPVTVRKGEFEVELDLPQDLKPGKYILKAYAAGAIGAVSVEIP
jgi:hypothetical protein